MDELIKFGLPEYAKANFPVSVIGFTLSFYGASLCFVVGRFCINLMKEEIAALESILDKLG